MFRKTGKNRLPAIMSMVSMSTLVCVGLLLACWFRGGDDMGNFLKMAGDASPIPYQLGNLVLAHALNATIVLFALWRCWHRRRLPNGMRVVFLMTSIFVWVACGAFEAAAIPLSHKIVWSTLEYLGMLATPLALLVLALEFGPGGKEISAKMFGILGAATFAIWLVVPTNSWHGLLWTEFVEFSAGVVQYRHGPGYILVIGYAYLLVLIGAVRFVRAVLGLPRHFRRMGIQILVALMFPLATSLVDISGAAPPGIDPAPFGFSLMGISISVSILGSQLLGILPIVRAAMGERLREAVLVFDEHRRLVDFSPAAYRLMDGHLAIGMKVDSLDAPWRGIRGLVVAGGDAVMELAVDGNRWYEARSNALQNGASSPVRGALVVLYDVSLRKEREQLEG